MPRQIHRDDVDSRNDQPVAITGILGLKEADGDFSSAWVAESVRMVSTFWPLFMLVKLGLLPVVFGLSVLIQGIGAFPWGVTSAMILADLAIWLTPRTELMRRQLPYRQMRLLLIFVAISAVATGSFCTGLHALPQGGMMSGYIGHLILALLALAVLGHQRLPGLVYCAGLGVSALTMGHDSLLLFALILTTLAISMLMQARYDGRRLLTDRKTSEAARRAQHLLNGYEEAGRGWFWETDRNGAMTYISDNLARSLGMERESLIGCQLTDLVMMDGDESTDVERTLGFHMTLRSSFSEVPVRATVTQDERWWAMSGSPIINEYGQFMGFRGNGTDLTAMKRSQAEVARLAEYDSLTGLANRAQMQRMLARNVVRPDGRTGECALFLLDLDRFKNVNDTLGHPAGDALLKEVSQRLKRVVADRGIVGRLGGDEFEVLLPGVTDHARLGILADAIIASLSHPYTIQGTQVVIGASVGIALCPQDGESSEELVRNADLALYAAKGDGRGVHRFYSSKMLASAEDRRSLEEDLRHALAHGGLHLVYQPVVSARTERISGFETLLRWNHPTRGAISPALFIPIAEDAGLITVLGEWVMRTACNAAAQWPEETRVAVNVSPLQFINPALPGIVMNALAASGLAAERLELEITETAFIHEGEVTDHMFAQLKGLGVRLALDDFGTGYSSLGYLRKAPFDKIKIDQSFVRGTAIRGSRNAAIITSIVSLAEALGMDTTAEGVETHDELALVRSLGCSHIQGYIYGKGGSAEEILKQLEEQGMRASAVGFQSSRPPRRSMLRSVSLRHQGNHYIGRVRNISSGGAMVEGLWNVPQDTRFQIELAAGFTVEAITRWSVDDRIGVQFIHPIELRVLDSVPPVRLAG